MQRKLYAVVPQATVIFFVSCLRHFDKLYAAVPQATVITLDGG
jgi:hypothetical protein